MDPITFEIVRHRLFRVVDEAIITLKHVSGSAITNEGHDLMVSLYRADGSLLMGGVGFLHHLTSAAQACKHVVRRFAGRIYEGDVFLLNDPYTAALHTSDIYLIAPIHYEGQLVAWSACFVHVYDIGAMNPGGFSPDSRDIYTEGFSSPGLKLVERGVLRADILDTLLNMVRSPEMVSLDIRSMIACNNVARERMVDLIRKYGPATVDEVCATLIGQSEKLLRARLRELPNGRWEARQYLEILGETSVVRLAVTKEDDELIFDFTGSSPQSPYGVNCSFWASWGGLFAPLFPLLCYDITWNEGVIKPVKAIAPEGSIVNCTRPAPVSIATIGAIQSVNNVSLACISKMLAASEKYAGEATATWHGSHVVIFMVGKNQKNADIIGIMTETFGGAGGARSFADGIDMGGEIPNPISRMANVELIEGNFPLRYLFRRRKRDSAGAGRFRGGAGGEFAVVTHDAPQGKLHYVMSSKGNAHPMSDGLAGGFPGAPCDNVRVAKLGSHAGANPPASFAQSLQEMAGETERVSWGVFALEDGDGLYVRWNGGGGFGDPLERPAADVLVDVLEGITSPETAKNVYGIALEGEDRVVNEAATARRRDKMRAARRLPQAAE